MRFASTLALLGPLWGSACARPATVAPDERAVPAPSAPKDAGPPLFVFEAGPAEEAVTADASQIGARPPPCLEARQANTTPTELQFVVHRGRGGSSECETQSMNLKIATLGLDRVLCSTGCGPFKFESTAVSPRRATFKCEGDMTSVAGSVEVREDVATLTWLDNPSRGDLLSPHAQADDMDRRTPSTAFIPLPCGAPVRIHVSGTTQWIPR